MKINLYKGLLGVALGVGGLTGAVGVLAQTSMPQDKTSPTQSENRSLGNSQSCPMKGSTQMDMSKMDMSKMMDCCKKMGMMKSGGPAENNEDKSARKPNTEQ